MFKLVPERTAFIDIEWPGLAEDGDPVTNAHRMKVVLVDQTEMAATLDDKREDGPSIKDFIKKVARGWDGVADEDGSPVPFSVEALAQLCEVPMYASGVGFVASYLKAWGGQAKVREKNSEPAPAVGRRAPRSLKKAA